MWLHKLKIAWTIIWVWGLIMGGACAQEKGVVIHERPFEGMEGYKVIIRETQEPEKRVYEAAEVPIRTYYEVPASAESQEALPEAASAPEELTSQTSTPEGSASPDLRRPRIPLRRNRYLLLKQPALSSNTPTD